MREFNKSQDVPSLREKKMPQLPVPSFSCTVAAAGWGKSATIVGEGRRSPRRGRSRGSFLLPFLRFLPIAVLSVTCPLLPLPHSDGDSALSVRTQPSIKPQPLEYQDSAKTRSTLHANSSNTPPLEIYNIDIAIFSQPLQPHLPQKHPSRNLKPSSACFLVRSGAPPSVVQTRFGQIMTHNVRQTSPLFLHDRPPLLMLRLPVSPSCQLSGPAGGPITLLSVKYLIRSPHGKLSPGCDHSPLFHSLLCV